jgi:hypothetical protein
MKIPLLLFPAWTIEQYKLKELALDGWVYIEMRQAVLGLPQAGTLANKQLHQKLAPFVWECVTAACKAFSLANAKGKGINELVIKSLD